MFYVGILKVPHELYKTTIHLLFASKWKHFILIFKNLILSENIGKA